MLALALATAGGVGFVPVAPGTAGAVVGVAVFLGLAALPLALFGLTLAALAALGVWASDEAERAFRRHDDGRIVIDEVAGQLVALAPLAVLERAHAVPWLVTGFVLFRVFDVWKPGPVRWAERAGGGTGVVLDDLVAGALAALVLAALVALLGSAQASLADGAGAA